MAEVALDLVADDRELRQSRVQDPQPELRVVLHREAQQGREHEEEREQREEPVVRDEGGPLPAAVVAELLQHGDRDREERVPALEPVQAVEDSARQIGRRHPVILASGAISTRA